MIYNMVNMRLKKLAFIVFTIVFGSWHLNAFAQNVNFSDTNLAAAVRSALNLAENAAIPQTSLAALILLNANNKDITTLTGLEYATGLTNLSLDKNNIVDISPLSGLTSLTRLGLDENNIVNLSPLSGLTSLTGLDLENNPIVDISPLSGLTSLTRLKLEDTNIRDIQPLASLTTLTDLDLTGCIYISEGFSSLSSLTNLESLWIGQTPITREELSELLPFLSSLDYLIISLNPFDDLSVLESLHSDVKLRNLVMDWMWNQKRVADAGWLLQDISPLVGLLTAGKLGTHTVSVVLTTNYLLDYDALYTHIPALLDGGVQRVRYSSSTPGIRSVSAEDEEHEGRPGTKYTLFVQAYNTYSPTRINENFKGVPVTWTVDGETVAENPTDDDGLSRVSFILGSHGDEHEVKATVPAKQPAYQFVPKHDKLELSFMVRADRDAPIRSGLTVTFEDYPEETPTDEFPLTIRFSEPVIDFQKEDITVETELKTGKGTATLQALTPRGAAQTYTATIGLPPGAIGTVKLIVRQNAALTLTRENIGPVVDTASEVIEFGEIRRPSVFPSYVAMNKVIFNEFRNAADDTHDWIELKNISHKPVSLKEWEVSLVVPHALGATATQLERSAMDRDIVAFPDITLPPGGILLIVNTDPSETDLIRGQNLENPNHNPALHPQYLVRPEMKLPSSPYLLILRSARDKNGEWEGFEDLVGDYHRGDVNYRTQIWPLRDTWVYTGTGARFSEDEVYQRVMLPRGHIPMKPKARGYFKDAWVMSGYESGLGYDSNASPETSLGTPGYAITLEIQDGWGQISFSEVMFATNERASLSQWIELYNNSSEKVDLEGWTLVLEVRDGPTAYHYTTLTFKPLAILPNRTVLIVSRNARSSQNIPESRIYNVYRHNGDAFRIGPSVNQILGAEGFALRLLSPDGTLVDMVGNLNGRQGLDKPRWTLPSGWTESGARYSLIRRYEDRVPAQGTLSESWVSAADTPLMGPSTYWGLETDNGTPGYRRGISLPVGLSSFRADQTRAGVVLKWVTQSELENAGFNILRSQHRHGQFVKVNPTLILGAGTTTQRNTYTWTDTTANPNIAYYYQIEDVSFSGNRQRSATVRMRGLLSASDKLLRSWGSLKKVRELDSLDMENYR